jgi:hypothetical protein
LLRSGKKKMKQAVELVKKEKAAVKRHEHLVSGHQRICRDDILSCTNYEHMKTIDRVSII